MTETTHPIIALWAHPRSRSTAMERVFMERKDEFTVFHEPFSVLYYVHENKGSTIEFQGNIDNFAEDYEGTKRQILQAAEKGPVFFKDMAYHSFGHIMKDDDFLKRLTHTFIIRNVADSINSHYALNSNLTQEEVGYERQSQLLDKIGSLSIPFTVVESGDLTDKPNEMIQAYCQFIGISHRPEALQWEAKQPEEFQAWASWHTDASQSQGIVKKTSTYKVTVENNELLKAMHDKEIPYYQRLLKYRLAPISSN